MPPLQGPEPPPQPYEDCLGCRVIGTVSMLGVSSYLLYERSLLSSRGAATNRALLAAGSGLFATVGLYRWVVGTSLDPFAPDLD